ncbi:MAG: gamma-glutamylcyclotransferase family protein [Lachnospiraceae bacterium]
MNKLYIAYGSNLSIEQMAYRCRTANLLKTGFIEDWALCFRSMGESDGPAYATIVPEIDSKVPVAIWEIDRLAEQALDIYEGYPRLYYKKNIQVVTTSRDHITGMVYIMNEDAVPGIPSQRYINTIIQGYIDNQLDFEYLHRLL